MPEIRRKSCKELRSSFDLLKCLFAGQPIHTVENLATDRYLRSQMDNDQYVPIRTIAGFPKVKRLTSDTDMIVQILRESPLVQVDEKGEKVRPSAKRCTIILREIPADTDKQEIEAMFDDVRRCPRLVSVERTLNNSWYVGFATEEDTQRAQMHLQMNVRHFRGKPICSRIKTGTAPLTTPTGNGTPSPQAPSVANDSGIADNSPNANGTNGMPTPSTVVQNGHILGRPDSLPEELQYDLPYPDTRTAMSAGSGGGYIVSSSYGQSPLVYNPPVVPHFDLGAILWQRGWVPQTTYRPGPSTVIQLPPNQFRSVMNVTTGGGCDFEAPPRPTGLPQTQQVRGMPYSNTFPSPYPRYGGSNDGNGRANPNRLSPQPMTVGGNAPSSYRGRHSPGVDRGGGGGSRGGVPMPRRHSPHHSVYGGRGGSSTYHRGAGRGGGPAYPYNNQSASNDRGAPEPYHPRGGGRGGVRGGGARRGGYNGDGAGFYGDNDNGVRTTPMGAANGGRYARPNAYNQERVGADRFEFSHYDKIRGRGGMSTGGPRRFGHFGGANATKTDYHGVNKGPVPNPNEDAGMSGSSKYHYSKGSAGGGRHSVDADVECVGGGACVAASKCDGAAASSGDSVDGGGDKHHHQSPQQEFDFDPSSFPELTTAAAVDGMGEAKAPTPEVDTPYVVVPEEPLPANKGADVTVSDFEPSAKRESVSDGVSSSKDAKCNDDSTTRVSAVTAIVNEVTKKTPVVTQPTSGKAVIVNGGVGDADVAMAAVRPSFSSVAAGKSSSKDVVVAAGGGCCVATTTASPLRRNTLPTPSTTSADANGADTTLAAACAATVADAPKRLSYAQMAQQKSSSAASSAASCGGRQAPSPDSALSDPSAGVHQPPLTDSQDQDANHLKNRLPIKRR